MTTTENREGPRASMLAVLRGMALLRGMSDAGLEELARVSHRRELERGAALFRAGEATLEVTIITSGLVKVVRYLPDGSEVILGLFGPREAVGLVAVLQQRPYPATALALTHQVAVLCIRSAEVLRAMSREPSLALALNGALLSQSQVLRAKIDVMSAGSVAQRLASLLGSLAERFGDELEDGTTFLPVSLSRGELSSLVGARVETTIRVLSTWRKQGLVETTREGFSIRDVARLNAVRDGVAD
ncbi:MAG: Crp/Fnr family transcriptional regulator [Deltaproteobacteria bacterium]|nr:Crp/Fnr family transcriptional regulator [Deltaproteobacteria bacterium]